MTLNSRLKSSSPQDKRQKAQGKRRLGKGPKQRHELDTGTFFAHQLHISSFPCYDENLSYIRSFHASRAQPIKSRVVERKRTPSLDVWAFQEIDYFHRVGGDVMLTSISRQDMYRGSGMAYLERNHHQSQDFEEQSYIRAWVYLVWQLTQLRQTLDHKTSGHPHDSITARLDIARLDTTRLDYSETQPQLKTRQNRVQCHEKLEIIQRLATPDSSSWCLRLDLNLLYYLRTPS